jgi:hypothetical protein
VRSIQLGLDKLEASEREAEEFAAFMASRDAGHHLPLRDSPKSAAFKLSAREDARQNTEAALTYGDRVARAQAFLAGDILRGIVQDPRRTHLQCCEVENVECSPTVNSLSDRARRLKNLRPDAR